MSYDFGIPDFLTGEYDRFVTGLDALSDGGQRKARSAAARCAPANPSPSTVAIPGWDDVVHIRPRPQISPELREQHYAALRKGEASPLSPELQTELERRSRRARLFNSSASPEYAKAYGQVMTAIDNVQDLLSTLATVGRLSLIPAIRGLEMLGAAELPFISGASRLGVPVFGRMIPILGIILTAGDLLRLLNQLGLVAFPFYAAVCAGPRAALAAGVPAMLMGPALKLRAGGLARLNPFGRAASLKRSFALRSWTPTIYNIIEAVQTTDALFGVGMAFGGIVGAIQDFAFATVQRSRGKDVEIVTQPVLAPVLKDWDFLVGKLPLARLHDMRQAAMTLAYGPIFARTQENFTVDEHVEFLAAFSAALSFNREWIEHPLMERSVNLALDGDLAPPSYGARAMQAELLAAGLPEGGFGLWPLPGNPERIRGEALLRQTAQEIPHALRELLEPNREQVIGCFIGACVTRITERCGILITGNVDAWQETFSSDTQVIESLARANRWPNTGEGEEKCAAFFLLCAAYMERTGRKSLGPVELDQLAKDANLTLIRALPPDAPFPESFFPGDTLGRLKPVPGVFN
jgi:hypothetical protein